MRRAVHEEPGEAFWGALFVRHFAALLPGVPAHDVQWRATYLACSEAACGEGWKRYEGLRVWRLASAIVCALDD